MYCKCAHFFMYHKEKKNKTMATVRGARSATATRIKPEIHDKHAVSGKHEVAGKPDVAGRPLPAWLRFYLYGMHGLLDEIVFTALFDVAFHSQVRRWMSTVRGYRS